MVERAKQYLLVGLGNPGSKYARTRHNLGFQFLDYLAETQHFSFGDSKWQSQLGRVTLWGCQLLLSKPETYMNLSGQAVAGIAAYYRIPPQRILIIHDDIDLEFGRFKVVRDRGAGGHKGVSSVIAQLGDRSIARIRVGVGRPEFPMSVDKYVLASFNSIEWEAVCSQMQQIEEAVRLILTEGPEAAMNAVNQER